jgi:hypothetical protein
MDTHCNISEFTCSACPHVQHMHMLEHVTMAMAIHMYMSLPAQSDNRQGWERVEGGKCDDNCDLRERVVGWVAEGGWPDVDGRGSGGMLWI